MPFRSDTVLQETTDAFFAVDPLWRVAYVNQPARLLYRRLFGRDLVEAEGRRVWELLPKPARVVLKRYCTQALRQQSPAQFELCVRSAQGTESWLDLHLFPSEEGLSVFCRDITELKRLRDVARLAAREKAARADAEAARQAAETERQEKERALAELDAILASAPVGLATLDVHLRCVHVNEALARLTGRPRGEHLGRTPAELTPELAVVEPLLRQVLRTGEPIADAEISVASSARSGEHGHWLASFHPTRGVDGAVSGVGVSVVDVTTLKQTEAALRDREERWRALFHQNAAGMAQLDLDGRFLQVNQRLCEILDRSSEAILRLTFADVTHPEDLPNNRRLFDAAVRQGEGFVLEKRCLRPDGAAVWVRVHGSLVLDGARQPRFVAAAVEDITERKQREEEMRCLMADARCLLWSATVTDVGHPLYLAWDQRFPIQDAAQQFIPLPLLEGETYRDAWYRCRRPEDRDRCDRVALAAIRGGRSYEQEFRVQCADGGERWVREDVRVEPLASGGRWSVIGVATDVTEQVLARQALQESRDRQRVICQRLAALHTVTLELQKAATVDDLCRQAIELGRERLGFDRLGLWLVGSELDVLHGTYGTDEVGGTRDEREVWFRVEQTSRLLPVLQKRAAFACVANATLHAPDGPVGQGIHAIAALWNGERVLGVMTADNLLRGEPMSTEQQELMAVYAASVGHLYTLKCADTELRRRADELADADRRKDEFLAMLAHELRNPLAPIVNAAAVLRESAVDDSAVQRQREIIQRQANHMARMVDDLLDVSRITRGKIELRKEIVQLSEIARRAAEGVAPLMSAREHEFSVTLPGEPVWLQADPTRMEQVLVNLLTNAAKYTEAGGRVTMDAMLGNDPAGEGSCVVIRVGDNGIGIAPELLPRVFEPFTQAEQSLDRARGGLGIGLTLAQSLVQIHGGALEASSAGLGCGSEFTIRMPVLSIGSLDQGLASFGAGAALAGPQPGSSNLGRRVLVVEDNLDAAETLRDLLELWGHEPRVAHRGEAGLAEAERFLPEVALLDIGLPGMDGYEVARRLRALPACQDTLLIAVTGYGQAADRRQAEAAGFDLHLTKPVDLDELRNLLQQR